MIVVADMASLLRHPLQDAVLLDMLLEQFTHKLSVISRVLAGCEKSSGYAAEMLIEISHVVNERERPGVMDKAETRHVAERTDDGGAKRVETRVGRR